MSDPIRVLIADDHAVVRLGVRALLAGEGDIEVVGEAVDGNQAMYLTESTQPNVVLMDIVMPDMGGLEATHQICTRWPGVYVLVLTMHRSDEYFFEMLKAGASGYVLKGADPRDLIAAVRVVSQGGVFLYPALARRLVQEYLVLEQAHGATGPSLSSREREILRLLAEGYSNKEIAEKLVISLSTIHSHRSNIMHKIGLGTVHELVQFAKQCSLK